MTSRAPGLWPAMKQAARDVVAAGAEGGAVVIAREWLNGGREFHVWVSALPHEERRFVAELLELALEAVRTGEYFEAPKAS